MVKTLPAPTQRIAYQDNPIMALCWSGFIHFCSHKPEILQQFERDTKLVAWWQHPRTPLEQMIDTATGADLAILDRFIDWVNAELWGEDPFRAET